VQQHPQTLLLLPLPLPLLPLLGLFASLSKRLLEYSLSYLCRALGKVSKEGC
jgi:hypothetical protein